ncbi:hypothetical protein C8R45DRAFT_930304 [Mycena sanguinolenta]|nr:hypothetical protein C8R45DRAFT_930304 [Mycena sanguinolenta]
MWTKVSIEKKTRLGHQVLVSKKLTRWVGRLKWLIVFLLATTPDDHDDYDDTTSSTDSTNKFNDDDGIDCVADRLKMMVMLNKGSTETHSHTELGHYGKNAQSDQCPKAAEISIMVANYSCFSRRGLEHYFGASSWNQAGLIRSLRTLRLPPVLISVVCVHATLLKIAAHESVQPSSPTLSATVIGRTGHQDSASSAVNRKRQRSLRYCTGRGTIVNVCRLRRAIISFAVVLLSYHISTRLQVRSAEWKFMVEFQYVLAFDLDLILTGFGADCNYASLSLSDKSSHSPRTYRVHFLVFKPSSLTESTMPDIVIGQPQTLKSTTCHITHRNQVGGGFIKSEKNSGVLNSGQRALPTPYQGESQFLQARNECHQRMNWLYNMAKARSRNTVAKEWKSLD